MKLPNAIDRIIDRCNLIGDDCDVIKVMYQYKEVMELDSKQFDEVYDLIVKVLGF